MTAVSLPERCWGGGWKLRRKALAFSEGPADQKGLPGGPDYAANPHAPSVVRSSRMLLLVALRASEAGGPRAWGGGV